MWMILWHVFGSFRYIMWINIMNFHSRYNVSSYPCFKVYTCTRLSSVKGIYLYNKYFRKYALFWIHIRKGVRFGYVHHVRCTSVHNLKCSCVHIGEACPYGECTQNVTHSFASSCTHIWTNKYKLHYIDYDDVDVLYVYKSKCKFKRGYRNTKWV